VASQPEGRELASGSRDISLHMPSGSEAPPGTRLAMERISELIIIVLT